MVKTFRGQLTILTLSLGLAVMVIAYAGWWLSGCTATGLLAGGGAGVIMVAAICYILFTPIHVNLLQVLENTQKAINGDLTGHIEKKNYGWGELNVLIDSIRRIIKGVHKWFALVKDASVTLDHAAGQITAGTEQVSTGSQEQAEQVTRLLHNIENLSGQAEDCARQAGEADQAARLAIETTTQGSTVIKKVMDDINLLNQKFEQLNVSSNRIVEFLEVIQSIASQTNLLALNAAIEAARAGEHGRGFAVVAEEVRKLAENSEKATKEVGQIVEEIKAGVADTVQAVQSSLARSQEAEAFFSDINKTLNNTSTLVGDITRVAKEQADSTAAMLGGAQSIAAVAQQAAASSQETAAVAQELTSTAEKLKKVADIWKFSNEPKSA